MYRANSLRIPVPARAKAAALLASLSLLLSACFMSPGKFESELTIMDDSSFTYTYEGEIFFLGLSALAKMGAEAEADAAADAAVEVTCYDEETYEERECTAEELEQQTGESGAPSPEQAEQLSAMLGGIDPSDPEAAEELRQILLRQKGWDRVEAKGDGLFEVTYSVSGTLGHDFMFPLIEDIPPTNPFVQFFLRDGNIVRINAPGFAPQDDSSGMGGMSGAMGGMAGLSGMAALADESDGDGDDEVNPFAGVPQIDGTFRIITNGKILANNTDEGPGTSASGQVLEWKVSPRTRNAPTALIDLSR